MQAGSNMLQKQPADSSVYELTRSLCPQCKRLINAQVCLEGNKLIMRKRCATHGWFEALASPDAEGYVDSLKYNKPGAICWELCCCKMERRPLY